MSNDNYTFANLQDEVDKAENMVRSSIDQLLRRMFWSEQEQEHLIPTELYDEFVDIVLNPFEGKDYISIHFDKANAFVEKFRNELRKKKDLI